MLSRETSGETRAGEAADTSETRRHITSTTHIGIPYRTFGVVQSTGAWDEGAIILVSSSCRKLNRALWSSLPATTLSMRGLRTGTRRAARSRPASKWRARGPPRPSSRSSTMMVSRCTHVTEPSLPSTAAPAASAPVPRWNSVRRQLSVQIFASETHARITCRCDPVLKRKLGAWAPPAGPSIVVGLEAST